MRNGRSQRIIKLEDWDGDGISSSNESDGGDDFATNLITTKLQQIRLLLLRLLFHKPPRSRRFPYRIHNNLNLITTPRVQLILHT